MSHFLHIFLIAKYTNLVAKRKITNQGEITKVLRKKKTLSTVFPAFQNLSPSPSYTHINTQAQTHTPRNKGAILFRKGQQFSPSDRGLFLVRGCCPISGHPPLAPQPPSGPPLASATPETSSPLFLHY